MTLAALLILALKHAAIAACIYVGIMALTLVSLMVAMRHGKSERIIYAPIVLGTLSAALPPVLIVVFLVSLAISAS